MHIWHPLWEGGYVPKKQTKEQNQLSSVPQYMYVRGQKIQKCCGRHRCIFPSSVRGKSEKYRRPKLGRLCSTWCRHLSCFGEWHDMRRKRRRRRSMFTPSYTPSLDTVRSRGREGRDWRLMRRGGNVKKSAENCPQESMGERITMRQWSRVRRWMLL